MSWAAHIEHTAGGLAITFAEPLTRLDMTADVAAHLASLLAVEARQRMAGVARTLEAENAAHFQRPTMGRKELSGNQSRATVARVGESQKRLYIGSADAHPLCCDCDACLNGDTHDH